MREWLRNFWYVVAEKGEVTADNQPLRKTVLGQDLALFIDSEGKIAAVNDICPHMGAALSLGSVNDGRIVCPYHHKEFTSGGKCTKVPSIPMGKIPSGLMVDSYPVVERYGLLWVFMGDLPEDQRPPIVEVPDLEDDDFQHLLYTCTWNGSVRPMLENLIDFTHFSYLHANTFGSGEHPFMDEYKVKKTKYEASCRVKVKINPDGWFFPEDALEDGESPDVDVHCRYHAPTMVVNSFSVGKYRNTTLFTFTPTVDGQVEIRMLGCRNYEQTEAMSEKLAALGELILEEDRTVVESCVPEVLPQPSLVPVDKYLGASRQIYHSFLSRDEFRVDDFFFATQTGGFKVVIPSPVRNDNSSFARRWEKRGDKESQLRGCGGCTSNPAFSSNGADQILGESEDDGESGTSKKKKKKKK